MVSSESSVVRVIRGIRGSTDPLEAPAASLALSRSSSQRAGIRAELVLTSGRIAGDLPAETAGTSTSFTIFEGTSEIQRMIIGRAVTGLDVRQFDQASPAVAR